MSCSSSAGRASARSKASGYRAYGKRYDFTHSIPQIVAEYGPKTAEELRLTSKCASPAA